MNAQFCIVLNVTDMQKQSIRKPTAQGFILLSALALLSVSVMAFSNPQSVMDLVGVKLTNTDAFSSIRGVYGGVGLTLFITLIYLMLRDVKKGLVFLSLLWGSYALSRILTIFTEGALGAFGRQWLLIESIFCLIALVLLWTNRKVDSTSILQSNATR
jgi:nitrate reductase gamma subunit